MIVDLHNHTKRCNHAYGESYEYVDKAISCGIDIFGFACHAPMDFDKNYRMGLDDIEDYISEISNLRDIYKGKIDIRVGFEVDYIANKEYLIEDKVINSNVDYLIGSVHFLNNWGFDNDEFIGTYKSIDIKQAWIEYLNSIDNMARCGIFDIIGHFDLFKIFNNKPDSTIMPYIVNTLETIKNNGLVIEINSAGFRKMVGELYPSIEILHIVKDMDIPITFSSDAHSPDQVGFKKKECIEIAKEIGFKNLVCFKNRKMEIYSI